MEEGDPGADHADPPEVGEAGLPRPRPRPRPLRPRQSAPEGPDPAADDRSHAVFVLSCMGIVFATVFTVPVIFLRGASVPRRAPAPVVEPGGTVGAAVGPGESGGPGTLAAHVPSEADLSAVSEDEDPTPAASPPPPQTISDACRRVAGYGTLFVEPREGESGIVVREGAFGRRSFYVLVKETTQDVAAVAAIQDAVRRLSLFDFRRIRPDDRYRLFLDGAGRIRMFEYAVSETEMFHVVRTGEASFLAHRVEVPVEIRATQYAGRVQGSLGRSLVAAGLDQAIIPLITDIFSFAVDFSREARTGDGFRLAVEERWIGGKFNRYTKVLAFDYVGAVTGEIHAYAFDVDGKTRYFAADGSSLQRVFLTAPCRYEAISSRFDPHRMHPILNRRMPHEGVDLVAPSGTPVYSIADGTLAFHGERGPNGQLVVIEHAGNMISYYAHLSGYAPGLRDGMTVRKGQLVGYVGTTGRSTGPHLHFGIKVDGGFVDPEAYLKSKRGQPVPDDRMEAFRAAVAAVSGDLERLGLPAGPAPPAELPTPEVGLVPASDSAP